MKKGSKTRITTKKVKADMKASESLFDKMIKNKKFKKRYEIEKRIFEIKYQLEKLMEEQGISQKALADKLGIDKSVVSKDISGGLKNAGLKKLQAIANVLDCEFIPLFIPKDQVDDFKKEMTSLGLLKVG